MKNSIEEDMKSINKGLYELEDSYELHQARWAKRIFENIKEKLDHILSDYKRVLKENEELLQEKINNQKIIASAQNDMLNYQAGFEDGKNGRTSAVQSIIENQQYYIFQKQIEKYEGHIEKLQKENEELRAKWDKDTHILQNKLDYANADRIDLAQHNKELRKENEELKFEERSRIIGKYGDAEIHDVINRTLSNDYIPVQKIKDIINRIDYDIKKTKEIISKNTNIYASYRKNDYQIVRLRAMNTKSLDIKKRLQELLDGSDADVGSIESEE